MQTTAPHTFYSLHRTRNDTPPSVLLAWNEDPGYHVGVARVLDFVDLLMTDGRWRRGWQVRVSKPQQLHGGNTGSFVSVLVDMTASGNVHREADHLQQVQVVDQMLCDAMERARDLQRAAGGAGPDSEE